MRDHDDHRSGRMLELVFDAPVAVVGDVHGDLDALRRLLERLGELPLVVLGDVGDRGPDTRGVIDLLAARGAQGVLGNHEQWLIAWARGEGFDSFALHPVMGGQATLDSYGVTGRSPAEIEAERRRVPPEHLAWLERLADAIDLEVAGERYWLVHGGVPDDALELPPAERVAWFVRHAPQRLHGYRQPLRGDPGLGRPLIVGHQPVPEPIVEGPLIALDTGADTGGAVPRLTALVLPRREVISVPARRKEGSR